ncbi:hypothetical protein EMIT074MI3_11268 [Bacillus licheniformis]
MTETFVRMYTEVTKTEQTFWGDGYEKRIIDFCQSVYCCDQLLYSVCVFCR